jgi:dTDP-4-amino-4,6-dideoxygalactose transaminase
VLQLPEDDAIEAEHALANAGVETRRWWGDGAHLHPSTNTLPRSPLPTTDALAKSTISVPFYRDLKGGEIEAVANTVRAVTAT